MAVLCMARPWKHPDTGIYYFRRVIPKELRPFISGKGTFGSAKWECRQSLHTKHINEAKRLYADVAALCDDEFSRRKAAKARAEASVLPPPPVGRETRPSLRVLAGELGQEIIRRNSGPPGDAAFRLGRSIPPGPWGDRGTPWAYSRYVLASSKRGAASPAAEEFVTLPAREFVQGRGMTLTADEWEEFCGYARDAIDAALEELQRRYRGDPGDRSDGVLLQRFAVGSAVSRPKVSIKGLIDTWAKVRPGPASKNRTREKYERRLREFSEFLGHDDAAVVTSQDLRRWRDQSVARGYSVRTINFDCLAVIKAIFKVAESEGVLPAYPFTGSYGLAGATKKSDRRRPYEPEEASRVLRAARDVSADPFLRWVPWLLAYTGARVGEIAQLRKENVKSRDGIHYIQITDEGDDKSIKNEGSAREVPLHPAVINEGFLDFVQTVGAGEFLFPLGGDGGYERRTSNASQGYMRWLRKVVKITDTKIVSHSWRHRMEDELRDIDAPDDVAHAITGRTVGGSRGLYGKTGRPSLKTLARWMAKIPPVKFGGSDAKRS